MKKTISILIIAVLLASLTACGNAGNSPSESLAPSSTSESDAAVSSDPVPQSQIPQGVSLLSAMDKLKRIDSGGIFPDINQRDREYGNCIECNAKELSSELYNILSNCMISAEPPVPVGKDDPPNPTSGCVTMELTDDTNNDDPAYYIASVYETGEVYYIYTNDESGWMKATLADGAYPAFRQATDKLEAEAKRMIYAFSGILNYNNFLPESTHLRLRMDNRGARPARGILPFTIEKKDGENWKELAKVTPATNPDCFSEPRKVALTTFDLTAIPGGQDEGDYRILTAFSDGVDNVELSFEYTISADATDVSRPPPPEMTPENQEYCDKYVARWGFYSPFDVDFSEDNYFTRFHSYLLYHTIEFERGTANANWEKYGEWIPADVFEKTIQSRFLLTSEVIREATGTDPNGYNGEYYDASQNAYYMPGGYGGGAHSGVVMNHKRDGDLLTLSVNWYDMDDKFVYSNDLTIRIDSAEEYHYIANKVTADSGGELPARAGGGGF